ncbi:MAG: hypothetical protein GF401_02195 [Chitinivibrionales bacterium]|nr:hypothetical protein [Chitinivibrionales bacterium]
MRLLKSLIVGAIICTVFAGCGLNPFGAGQRGLKLFANIGKAMERPEAINEENNNKETVKAAVSSGQGMAKRLAKAQSGAAEDWMVDNGISWSGDTLVYFEKVNDKPTEEDPDRLATGYAEVKARYTGDRIDSLAQLQTNLIDAVYSWYFIGRERQTQGYKRNEVCSLQVHIQFSNPVLGELEPGNSWFWAKNISETDFLGKGDTTSFQLDSIDRINYTQSGEGHYYDAKTGDHHDEGSRSFTYYLTVIHKNTLDEAKPYHRYQDNEGIVEFYLPWEDSESDQLYFRIYFERDYQRRGKVYEGGPNGILRIEFTHDEKMGDGEATFYDKDGNVIEHKEHKVY